MEPDINSRLNESADYIRKKIHGDPEIAVVLGSGLGSFSDMIDDQVRIPYSEIPHFARSTVEGHAGELIFGSLKGRKILCMKGRFHFYEGYSFETVTYPHKAFRVMGIEKLILTNAVGGINQEYKAGDFMIIQDHLNLMGSNPLIGKNNDTLGPRFPDMSEIYSPRLRNLAKKAGERLGIGLKEGVYAALTGPSYETPAEIRMLRLLGADAVGMSTAPEAIVACHMGMEVLAISCVTNAAAGIDGQKLSHDEVTAVADAVKKDFTRLVAYIIQYFDESPR